MANTFAKIAFTPAVLEFQERYGSRRAYSSLLDESTEPGNTIGEIESAFISARDGFYQSTISENGWPYVQFKGGPRGFLKVINSQTIAYADFSGNKQYLSVGNLSTNDRVTLILVDYPNKRRVKIWGRAKLVNLDEDPTLIASLHDNAYHAKPERAVVITIEALSWNCPQHLPQRFTVEELQQQLTPIFIENKKLKAENASLLAKLNLREDQTEVQN